MIILEIILNLHMYNYIQFSVINSNRCFFSYWKEYIFMLHKLLDNLSFYSDYDFNSSIVAHVYDTRAHLRKVYEEQKNWKKITLADSSVPALQSQWRMENCFNYRYNNWLSIKSDFGFVSSWINANVFLFDLRLRAC